METQPDIQAVILAGGSGTRLWPLSREQLPKQFLSIDGGHTLLEATINRLHPLVTRDHVLIVTKKDYAQGEAYHALSPYQTLLEPEGRNTAPAIALAAAWLTRNGDDPVMLVLPADHVIKEPALFQAALRQAVAAAQSGQLVTFGITPSRPDTGFGYIQAGADLGGNVHAVQRFAEKPDLATAESFIRDGGYYWNSGMFVWKASTILKEIARHLPEVTAVLDDITAAWQTGNAAEVVARHFPRMPSISIDYGVLEKTANVALIPCDIGWSDVGSWDAVHEVSDKDAAGNATQGNVIAVDCRNALIQSNKRLVAAIGVEDLNIVETADAVLITKRGESQRVREVVDVLKRNNAQEHVAHLTVQRPWGSYTVLESADDFKMKRITVKPGQSLSLQRHSHRSEHWIVVAGTATVTCDDEVITVAKNQSTYIPIGAKHRLENRGEVLLEMIEVQVGEYLGEDDIERFDDCYGR
ncbi:MAG: mannose-1-phosphate guanylyltransferase/mannose-6-phosphate isomerase [Gammaproteobacteria bacterium HGW-Gammaproteobacteria-1]|jgi:mannose-1-phosphate guanylyltransferase/mannose-6-phosphate isomerase|nr:MAG: mannose-1-phosphate guanylyltransferase/mannose-6-phosphate isomerase [Gammaproteobacteria bacterium HGW-Gammaproteobacteria-1]